MKNKNPANVYRLPIHRFNAIPGSPLVYWIIEKIRDVFLNNDQFINVVAVKLGLSAVDVFRFNRYFWEVQKSSKWRPLMKGGGFSRWYGNNHILTNWDKKGIEVKEEVIHRYPYLKGNYKFKIRDEEWLGKNGLTFTNLGNTRFSARVMPEESLFDDTGPAIFSKSSEDLFILGLLNSSLANYLLFLINPSIHFQKGDLEKLPLPSLKNDTEEIVNQVKNCIYLVKFFESNFEDRIDFILPPNLIIDFDALNAYKYKISNHESKIDDEIYRIYEIPNEDRFSIEKELFGEMVVSEDSDDDHNSTEQVHEPDILFTKELLAIRLISYAIGIILGRFKVGQAGVLGSAIYLRSAFGIGQLSEPSEEEFNQLVGSPNQFAYIDPQGGRHVFSEKVEKELQALVLTNGIAVLDEGHEHDLTRRVGKALELMLGEQGAQDVIQQGAGGDLRGFLSKDYFTQYHLKWYRKRPVYWYIQSAKRSFGFVLFHEKIDKNTFYTLQHELANKRKAIQFQLEDLQKDLLKAQGSQRKQVEKNRFELHQLDEELAEFAQALEAITSSGYEPEPNWIDDGVILRMAPLWTVIPLWKSEPKKYWERLEKADFDWSHIAMKYWPNRVRERCKTDKSFAIAHGHEEWYEGD